VTVSLPTDLVERIDAQARAQGSARSAIMAKWLGAGARQQASIALDDEITAYYATSNDAETRESDAISQASLIAARRLDIEAAPRAKVTRRKSA
jgi:hypothetical protein